MNGREVLIVALVFGCGGGTPGEEDAAVSDAAVSDATMNDDGRRFDAHQGNDGSPGDAVHVDARPTDAGASIDALVECAEPADCVGLPPDDQCQRRTCFGQLCGLAFTSSDTAVSVQTAGDCQRVVCDGTGSTTAVADSNDLPDDFDDCTTDFCSGITPVFTDSALNDPCGSSGTLLCDGDGACVGCTLDSHCLADTFCRDYFCDVDTCAFTAAASGTALPLGSQITGNCQELRCEGGGPQPAIDNTDLPTDDGNECTGPACVGGAPLYLPEPLGTSCDQDGGSACNGAGVCL